MTLFMTIIYHLLVISSLSNWFHNVTAQCTSMNTLVTRSESIVFVCGSMLSMHVKNLHKLCNATKSAES